jgi:3,4-dihydroxy 2-butanone 4-phosphate synthase/GTP cyclohydrolase II
VGKSLSDSTLSFDVSAETQSLTTFDSKTSFPRKVHVEPALVVGDPVGGHFVTGHVHFTAIVSAVETLEGGCCDLFITLPTDGLTSFKNSITVDGVSLTVASVEENRIRIALIPHTVRETLLCSKLKQRVNIELPMAQTVHSALLPRVTDDEAWMDFCIEESLKGRFSAPPNPWVGSCLVDETGNLISKGHHVRPGEPHAEVNALSNVPPSEALSHSTLYVTLEPCSHTGRTPPCVDLILEKKIKRVVIGVLDPDPRVSGKGVSALQEAGVQVNVLDSERVNESLKPYLYHRRTGLPFVVAKLALTVDGCYCDSDGVSKWITGPEARAAGHLERAKSGAVMVGKRTDAMDRPQLNVRYGHEAKIDQQPLRIVASSEIPLEDQLRDLAGNQGVLQVLLEGGPRLQASALEQNLVQEFLVFRSGSKTAGPGGYRWEIPEGVEFESLSREEFANGDSLQRFAVRTKSEAAGMFSEETAVPWSSVEEAVAALRQGNMVVVMDESDRENEGDLFCLADRITESQMQTMIRHTSGIVCVSISEELAGKLALPRMVADNHEAHKTQFTVSCDAAHGISTGASAKDRALTCRAVASGDPGSIVTPGHVFPLVSQPGWLSQRRGHTEAGRTLAVMAGGEAMVLSELMYSNGTMMREGGCSRFAAAHGYPIIHIRQLLGIVPPLERSLLDKGELQFCDLPMHEVPGSWKVACTVEGHRILVCGQIDPRDEEPILLRIHSDCWTGDVLGSKLCDCGEQLTLALHMIAEAGRGIVILPAGHEGRGIGLAEKIKAYRLQASGVDTYEANKMLGHPFDARSYSMCSSLLHSLGIRRVVLLSANPEKAAALGNLVHSTLPVKITPGAHNQRYLASKETFFSRLEPNIQEKTPPPETQFVRHDVSALRIAIVRAKWHSEASKCLEDEICRHLTDAGATNIEKIACPGSFELPMKCQQLIGKTKVDVVVAIGILIRGETDHYQMVSQAATMGLQKVALKTNVPVINGILCVHDIKQMLARVTPTSPLCVGKHLAQACLEMAI